MKAKIFFSLLALTITSTVFARDSIWNLCQGDIVLFQERTKLVVNVYEHRNGLGRLTDLTLIYGGHTLTGSFDSTENNRGDVVLENGQATFNGIADVDFQKRTLELNGMINLQESTMLLANLSCETLAD